MGDLLAALAGLYLIAQARRLGAGGWTLLRMLLNWLIDGLIGVVPLVGDVFDVMFKVNERNMDLLASDLQRRGLLS